MSLLQAVNLRLLEAAVKVTPNPGGIPGEAAAQKLLNGVAAFGLLYCAGKVIVGAAQWSFGNRSGNYGHADEGKSRMVGGVLGAFGIGAAAAIVNFFFNAGTTVH